MYFLEMFMAWLFFPLETGFSWLFNIMSNHLPPGRGGLPCPSNAMEAVASQPRQPLQKTIIHDSNFYFLQNNDILRLVFSFLDINDVPSASATVSRWNDVLHSCDAFWHNIARSHFPEVLAVSHVLHSGSGLKTMDLVRRRVSSLGGQYRPPHPKLSASLDSYLFIIDIYHASIPSGRTTIVASKAELTMGGNGVQVGLGSAAAIMDLNFLDEAFADWRFIVHAVQKKGGKQALVLEIDRSNHRNWGDDDGVFAQQYRFCFPGNYSSLLPEVDKPGLAVFVTKSDSMSLEFFFDVQEDFEYFEISRALTFLDKFLGYS
uniref:F-box domain-containing protein n=1 Tax=Odontella aurita TaxID=265563 RepID=A0A6U6DQ32_9STRA|mmetsp:Transcript_21447/g.62720  ORF Transcript_21447/g.62720 Transcript_21447/m.62720 type:complete len:318 (+) Transcript_21447:364-1317(+)